MPSCFSMPPMRCSRPGVPGTAQGRARVCGSRLYGQKTSVPSSSGVVGPGARTARAGPGSSSTSGIAPGLGAVGQVAVGEQEDRGAVGQRDPGRLQGRVEAVGRGARARRSAPGPRRCGRTSPGAGRPARSWSADRWTGPPRWMSMTSSGSSRETASPIVSDFSATPGPGGRGHRQRAAEGRAQRRADAGDLVLGLEGAYAEVLVLAQLVQDVRGRGDRVRAQVQRQVRLLGRGDQPVGQGQVPGDVAVGAGGEGGRRPVRPRRRRRSPRSSRRSSSRPGTRRGSPRRSRGFLANLVRRNVSVPSVGRWYIHDSRPSANMFLLRSASLRESAELLERLDGQRRQRHRVHAVAVQRAVLQRARSRSRPSASPAW